MWSELRADHVIPLGALETLLQVPTEVFLRLADLAPTLEKLCAGEKPDVRPAGAPQSAAGFQEIEDDEPLPWDEPGGEDDYELSI